ncbi:MAG: nucleoside hydrolase [Planctomycetota bacterium]|nr:nucleoside hydrolase [Planctomycetota bacterium]
MSASERIPVLLDTDIGNDIDDAVCLAYLLKQARCELLGITTVSGPVTQRAALADAVCRAAGRTDVPIRAGCRNGINLGPVQDSCPQAAVLPKLAHTPPEEFRPGEAVAFLRERIRARPGEVTLLAIGPMTNLGLLFALDPEIPALLKRLVLMCGVFTNRGARSNGWREWNAICDPIATACVYRARPAEHLSVGLDVTTHCVMDSGACIKRFNELGGPLKVVASMTEVWAQHREKITFHDPLAATLIFDPELCGYQDGLVNVELKSDHAQGMTHWNPNAQEKPHKICLEVKAEAFFEHYFRTTA